METTDVRVARHIRGENCMTVEELFGIAGLSVSVGSIYRMANTRITSKSFNRFAMIQAV